MPMAVHELTRALKVERLTGSMGAEVLGLDLKTIDDQTVSDLKAALAEHGMLYFQDQTLTPDEHVALAARFGPLDINPMVASVPGHPEIYPFRRKAEDTG